MFPKLRPVQTVRDPNILLVLTPTYPNTLKLMNPAALCKVLKLPGLNAPYLENEQGDPPPM